MTSLEHRVLSLLRQYRLENEHFLLAVSGGLDSMALLHVFETLSRVLKFSFSIAHVHHGKAYNQEYRDEVFRLVERTCQNLSLTFLSNFNGKSFLKNPPLEKTEEALRKFRYEHLQEWSRKNHSVLVLAHHSLDQLETRLLRLIRGVGAQGFSSMKVHEVSRKIFRPFLPSDKKDIQQYGLEKKVSYKEDPTNQSHNAFRNWIRNHWLKDLENHQKGSIFRLSQSFEHLSEALALKRKEDFPTEIPRRLFEGLPVEAKKQALAQYMKSLNLKNYATTHVLEVLKRLEQKSVSKSQNKNFHFYMLGKKWLVSSDFIKAVEIPT